MKNKTLAAENPVSENDSSTSQTGSAKLEYTSVLLFWIGYLAITFLVGLATSTTIHSEVWHITAWGFMSSAGLIALTLFLVRRNPGSKIDPGLSLRGSSWNRLLIGLVIGMASFGIHISIIQALAGPITFEWVPNVGAVAALIYFVRFLSTSCMEELGFRGYPLHRLTTKLGVWPAVFLTSLIFGLSHLSYSYDLKSIAFGVIPGGLLWGMSAIATRGLAMPIGLHAAWNFANWSAGGRSEVGLLRMIVDEDSIDRTQTVGAVSYVSIFIALTIAFWLVHRRNIQRSALSSDSLDP